MKLICFSDSHGEYIYMKRALLKNRDADAAFFLGDGLNDFDDAMESYSDVASFRVRGNCDFGYSFVDSSVPKTAEVVFEGKKIVYTHGDLYNAKLGISDLISLAVLRNADIVLFGHTHIPREQYISAESGEYLAVRAALEGRGLIDSAAPAHGIYLFNPGAISYRGSGLPSYGILTLTESSVLFSHGNER